MGKEEWSGPMVRNTSASTSRIRSTGLANLFGAMAGSTRESGAMASSMETAFMLIFMELGKLGSGIAVRMFDGLINKTEKKINVNAFAFNYCYCRQIFIN